MVSVVEIPQKRIVYTFNEKGGVGKTTCARGLLEVYRRLNINYQAFDADLRSAQLHRYYDSDSQPVQKINIFKIGEYDALLDELYAKKPDVVLVDLPGTSGEAFEQMEQELALFDQAKLLGYGITMMVVMSRTKDSIDALQQLMNYCHNKKREINYLAVLNLFFGSKEKFSRWQNSDTKKVFESKGGVEITMPEMYEEMYDFIDQRSLTFREAANCQDATFTNRSRAVRWLEEFEKELKKASNILGLGFATKEVTEDSTKHAAAPQSSAKKTASLSTNTETKGES